MVRVIMFQCLTTELEIVYGKDRRRHDAHIAPPVENFGVRYSDFHDVCRGPMEAKKESHGERIWRVMTC